MESGTVRRNNNAVLHTDSSMDEKKSKRTMTDRKSKQHLNGFLEAGRLVLQNRVGTERRIVVGVQSPDLR